MAEEYSHLVQDTANTSPKTVYYARPGDITIIKDVVICNLDTEVRKFSLAIVKNNEVLSNKNYLFCEAKIDPKETLSINTMWCLDPGSEIKFTADREDVLVINAFGVVVNS